MAWIADLAERQHYDDRNEASVKLAKEIKRAILNEEGQFPPFLPFI
jgi:cytochrome c551/c552